MFVAPNCSCGGGPEIRVVRGERIFIIRLDHGDKVQVRHNDVLFVSCAQCGVWLEFKEVNEIAAGT